MHADERHSRICHLDTANPGSRIGPMDPPEVWPATEAFATTGGGKMKGDAGIHVHGIFTL